MNTPNEVKRGSRALGEVLSSVLLNHTQQFDGTRRQLYCWELDALTWLLDLRGKYDDWPVGNAWIANFILCNEDAIRAQRITMDFNLKAWSEAKSA